MAMLPARRGGQNLTLVDPSREFEDIYDRVGRLMNVAFGDLGIAGFADAAWSPQADVSETDDACLVHLELPGVGKDQVDVQLQDRELVISGEIRQEQNGKRRQSSRRAMERPGRPDAKRPGPGLS
ncbi:MAG TPA: Hsp20/alpha crystallin family protein [Streptosporangiaceae bacterium]|nr:Hsp20/alpha crystallin family protein [Streptosporangiaceae bacterium]